MLSVRQLPATAIYYLTWPKSGVDTVFSHVVVNGGESYDSGTHTYPADLESWWTIRGTVSAALEETGSVKISIENVALSLPHLAVSIKALEAYAAHRFDAKSVLQAEDWIEGIGQYEGPTFADTENDVCIRFVTDANGQLSNVVWYAKERFEGTYFGGQPQAGASITLTKIDSASQHWPAQGTHFHFPSVQ